MLPIVAPTGLLNWSEIVFAPLEGTASIIVTEQPLGAASPFAHCTVLLTKVKSLPATAVPFTAVQVALAAPLEPPVRITVKLLVCGFCTVAAVAAGNVMAPVEVVAAPAAAALRFATRQVMVAIKVAGARCNNIKFLLQFCLLFSISKRWKTFTTAKITAVRVDL
jgi:hypothetical protein